MDTVTAAAVINADVVFLPGWTWEAEDYSKRHQNTVKVSVVYEARDFSRINAPNYDKVVDGGAKASFVIDTSTCPNYVDLHRKVLAGFLDIIEHEAREAYRVGGGHWGIFNPHMSDGQANYGNPDHDFNFGIA